VLVVLAGQFVEQPQHSRRIRHGAASCHPGNGRSTGYSTDGARNAASNNTAEAA
jgi:hypothetical protein